MIIFQFHKTNTPLGKLIRFFSGGIVNHVSIRIWNHIYEADFKRGVIKTYVGDWHKEHQLVYTHYFNIATSEEKHIIKWLDKQVGKKYDWFGVFSFVWAGIEQKIGAWYCSELATVVFAKIQGLPSGQYNQRQTPQNLLDIMQFNEHRSN